jgi:hypothetical protein
MNNRNLGKSSKFLTYVGGGMSVDIWAFIDTPLGVICSNYKEIEDVGPVRRTAMPRQ